MKQFKEMIIPKPKTYRMPMLELQGKWLHDLGFSLGTLVNAHFKDGCLTLSTELSAKNNIGILMVKPKRVRGRIRPVLLIDGFILKRLGYDSFDRVGLVLHHGQIQMTKINQFTTEDVHHGTC